MKELLQLFTSNWILFSLLGVIFVFYLLSFLGYLGEKLKKFVKDYWILLIAFVLIVFSFFAPYYFTKPAKVDRVDFTDTGAVGDTINGIMGPFIAIAAALLTFAAFIVQKQANELQIKATNEQIKKDDKQELENRVFNLLHAHRENVSDLSGIHPDIKNGQQMIETFCTNIDIIIGLITVYEKENNIKCFENKKDKRVFAFLLLCHGRRLFSNRMLRESEEFGRYSNKELILYIINEMETGCSAIDYDYTPLYLDRILEEDPIILNINEGYINDLSRYFRQLFQIIKFIDNSKVITIPQKKEYCKLLRTTMSNKEQEFLFNNIISPYGIPWEKNEYVTKYNVFKNVTSYTMLSYTPVDYLKEKYSYSNEELKQALDIYDYIDLEE